MMICFTWQIVLSLLDLRGIAAGGGVKMKHSNGRSTSSAYVRLFPTPSRAYAMGMPAQNPGWTAEMARALPDDGERYEVLDGELFVSPAPSFNHQRLVFHLARILDDYVRAHKLGEVFIAPADVEFSPQRLLQPDVFVIPPTPGKRPQSFQDVGRLLLSAEVLSAATARTARMEKRDILREERVPEYWIVDADARVFERSTPEDARPEVLAARITWQPAEHIPPLVIELPRFFAEALD
jgi:Uma2 family endonuclease